MNTALDPIVVGKLRHFGRRRRGLIWLRGICAAIVSFFVLISAVAFADWSWVLSDTARWSLSMVAYLGVVCAVWLTCLRRMIHRPSMDELASRVEVAEPELRENLLAAVELAADDPSVVHDSPTFRRLLQGQVAERMADVRVGSLLPWRLLGGWLAAAVLFIAVTAGLLYMPNTPIRRLVTRAILPGANVDRVSRIKVTILKPTPHSLMLAEDETVAVMVEISGGDVDDVALETSTPAQGTNKQSMRSQGDSVYVYNVQVADESIEYRILAGDAVTRKYRIESRARPRALAFHKTFHFPEYTGLDASKVTEKHGDLIALEGSSAEVVVELDQEVTAAELRIERHDTEEIESVVLEKSGAKRWRTTVQLDDPAVYKLHLVSAETGFENIFSPKYEVRPEADLIPRVGFVEQQQTTLLLPPNDILPLAAMAEDDLPLVKLEQQFSINGKDWESVVLDAEPAKRMTAQWEWDLIPLTLEQGDQVMTRLVATDRKGNVGESVPIRIVVSSTEFDPNRHKATLLKSAFYAELDEFSDQFADQQKRAKDLIARLRDASRPADAVAIDHSALRDIATKQHAEAGEVVEHIKELLREMPAGVDSFELDLVGRVIGRVQHANTNEPVRLLALLAGEGLAANQREQTLKQLESTFDRSADDAKRLAELYRDLMAHNVLAAIAFDLDALMNQQRSAVRWDSPHWLRLSRQETIVLNQFRMLKTFVEDQRPLLPRSTHKWLVGYQDWLDSCIERLEQGMESEDKLPLLQKTAATILRELESKQRVDITESRLPAALVNARRDFDNRSGTIFIPLAEMGGQANDVFATVTKLNQTEDPVESLKLQQELDVKKVGVQVYRASATGQLQTRRGLTQARVDADTQYAVDAGLTNRAVSRLSRAHEKDPLAEPQLQTALMEIAPAYRILEAGHEVAQVRDALQNLVTLERWRSQEISGRLDSPRQWDALVVELELAARKLREAGVANEIAAKIDVLRVSPAARDAARKITTRRYQRDAMVGAGYELSEMQQELTFVLSELEPVMAEARAIISKYVPSIPELAQETAEAIRDLEEQTTAAADETEDPQDPQESSDPADTPPTLEELQDEQEKINEQVDELIDALIEDANSQDLLDSEQLERARDADASIEMIRDAAAEMNQAMDEAVAAEPEDQPAKLSEAAEEQENTAEAIDKVAEHFENLDAGEDPTESREAIRPEGANEPANNNAANDENAANNEAGDPNAAQPEAGQPQQGDDQAPPEDDEYADAEELARMAEQNPQQLLAELEAELKRNPAMQEALSKISQNTLEQAKNALDDAAKQDDNLQRQVERADAEFQQKKKEVIEDLKKVTQEAANVANTLVAQANSAASQGKVPESQKKLAQAQQDLRNAQAKANQLNENKLLSEIKEAAQEIDEAVQKSSEALAEVTKETEAAEKEAIHANDKTRDAAKKNLENARKKFNDQRLKAARDVAKRAADVERRATQATQRAETALRNADNQAKRAKANADKNPDNQGLKNALKQAEARQDQAQEAVDQQKAAQQEAKEGKDEADADVKAMAEKKPAPLNTPNPAAELANEYSDEAAKDVEELAKKTAELAENIDEGIQLNPPAAALAQTNQRQQEIQTDVEQVAEDVARAARHERRLENLEPVDALENTAEAIEAVAGEEVEDSIDKLGDAEEQAAADAAEPAEGEPGEGEPGEGEPGEGEPGEGEPGEGEPQGEPSTPAAAARDAIEASEEAIAEQADQLGQILDAAQAAADAAQEAAANQDPAAEPGEPGQQPGEQPGEGEPGEGEPGEQPGEGEPGEQPGEGEPGEQPGEGEPGQQPGEGEPGQQAGEPGQGEPGQQPGQGQPQAASPAEQARAEMLAQTLDELDQQQAGAESGAQPTSPLSTLAQAAQAQRASMAAARAPYGSQTPPPNEALESLGIPATTGDVGKGFVTKAVNRDDGKEWGALRGKTAEETANGSREAVAAEYRQRVDAYFRVLAERARAKK